MSTYQKFNGYIEEYDEIEFRDNFNDPSSSSNSKKKKRLDPYNKEKERRNSKINPRFIDFDEDGNYE
jgi:hypothetical protein